MASDNGIVGDERRQAVDGPEQARLHVQSARAVVIAANDDRELVDKDLGTIPL